MGQVYTPKNIVDLMLDFLGYNSEVILGKHIIDNSAGDGAFLKEVVARYIRVFEKAYGKNKNLLKQHLERFIHGIEISKDEHKKCIENLNKIVAEHDIYNVNWDIINADAFDLHQFDGKMDFVVGNPPYVRIHNMYKNGNIEKIKKFSFFSGGMADLYIIFFEIGFKMLNEKGKLCYITPNTFQNSIYGKALREYIENTGYLVAIIDMLHNSVFDNISTYTVITVFDKSNPTFNLDYYQMEYEKPVFVSRLKYDEVFVGGKLFLGRNEDLETIRRLYSVEGYFPKNFSVKNGFATLSDSIFVKEYFNFKSDNFLIDVYKASTGEWLKCIYPYDEKGNPVSIEEIKQKNPDLFYYLLENREKLENRDYEQKWYLFGRSQAIGDTYKYKVAINTLVKDLNSLRIQEVPTGKGVLSGLYIVGLSLQRVTELLVNEDFLNYVKMLRKYKRNNYYTFSSRDLDLWISYFIARDYKKLRKNGLWSFE